MKYIFLDIDGVLNHHEYYKRMYAAENVRLRSIYDDVPYPLNEFDPLCVERVNRLVDVTGAEVVLSSSWRVDGEPYMSNIFAKVGLPKISGMTPVLASSKRGDEINEFMKSHPCDNYVILDDDDDILCEQSGHFVKCSYGTGFDDDALSKAITILTKMEHINLKNGCNDNLIGKRIKNISFYGETTTGVDYPYLAITFEDDTYIYIRGSVEQYSEYGDDLVLKNITAVPLQWYGTPPGVSVYDKNGVASFRYHKYIEELIRIGLIQVTDEDRASSALKAKELQDALDKREYELYLELKEKYEGK